MPIENKGPGGVGNSYGARTSVQPVRINSAKPKDVYNEFDAGEIQALVSGAGSQAAALDLDWLSLRSSGVWSTLTIPSPYSPTHTLHPSVVFFENGWRGYRYWMAYTPYPDSDAEYENPCVCASNDGATWVAVGSQPIVGSPTGAAYNSDTDLAYDSANDRLALVFREVGVPTSADGALKVMVSSDGVAWSSPVTIYTATGVATSSATDIAAPSLVWNATSSRWEIFGHNVKDNASAWPFVKITSASLLAGWDTSLTVLTFTPPSGRKWWHSEIRRLSGGAYVGLVQDNAGTLGSSGNLFSAYSADGTTFTYRLIDDWGVFNHSSGWYRPSFVVLQDPQTREWVVQAYGSRLATSGILQQTMRFDAASSQIQMIDELASILSAGALGGFSRVLHADTFNRADDATGLGTASGGGTYTQPGGPTNVIGISSNQAYNATTGNCRAVRDMGITDYEARAIFATKSAEMYVIVRYIDSSNYTRVGVASSSGQLRYQVVTSGSVVTDISLGTTPVNGDEIKVRCAGGEITVYRNGRRISKAINTQGLTTGTFAGLQMSGTLGGRMDNFAVVSLVAA